MEINGVFLDKNVIKTHLLEIKGVGGHVLCSRSQKVDGHVTQTQAIEKKRPNNYYILPCETGLYSNT